MPMGVAAAKVMTTAQNLPREAYSSEWRVARGRGERGSRGMGRCIQSHSSPEVSLLSSLAASMLGCGLGHRAPDM